MTWIFRRWHPFRLDQLFRRLQLVSAGLYSLGHGGNDAQKTMGIITGLLVAGGYLKTFEVPLWVILISHAAIALGTMFGGWRIVKTMGTKITKLQPIGGFCAETVGRHHPVRGHAPRHPGLHHPHHHRRHHRRGRDAAHLRGEVGRGRAGSSGPGS